MKQWWHISLKYLRYEHLEVVLRCLPSKETVELAILKKKSEGDVGPGPMGRKLQMNIMKQWRHIFLKYLRYEHIVVVLRCLPSKQTVGLAILKKKSEGDMGPGLMGEWV